MTHARISTPVQASKVGLDWMYYPTDEERPEALKALHVGSFEGMLTASDGYQYWWHAAVEDEIPLELTDEEKAADLADVKLFEVVVTVRAIDYPPEGEQVLGVPGLLHSRRRVKARQIFDRVMAGEYDRELGDEEWDNRDLAVLVIKDAVRALEADMCRPVDHGATGFSGTGMSTPRALAEAWPDDDWTGTRKDVEALLPGHTASAILSALQRGPYTSTSTPGQPAMWRRVPGKALARGKARKRGVRH